jgi:hypothetical protein
MNLKALTQLSHFVTLLFGIALGMSLCLFYQHYITIFIFDLSPIILLIVFISLCLRGYTHYIWRIGKYDIQLFD